MKKFQRRLLDTKTPGKTLACQLSIESGPKIFVLEIIVTWLKLCCKVWPSKLQEPTDFWIWCWALSLFEAYFQFCYAAMLFPKSWWWLETCEKGNLSFNNRRSFLFSSFWPMALYKEWKNIFHNICLVGVSVESAGVGANFFSRQNQVGEKCIAVVLMRRKNTKMSCKNVQILPRFPGEKNASAQSLHPYQHLYLRHHPQGPWAHPKCRLSTLNSKNVKFMLDSIKWGGH